MAVLFPSWQRDPTWQHIPPWPCLSIHTGGQCRWTTVLQLKLCQDTPNLPTDPSLPPFYAAPRVYGFGWTHVFWAECHFVILLCSFVFLLEERLKERELYLSRFWVIIMIFDSIFFMSCSLPTAASLFELTRLKPSVVWLHLKSVQNHQGWVWTMCLFVMLQLVALVMIIMCHKENILSLYAEQTAGTF